MKAVVSWVAACVLVTLCGCVLTPLSKPVRNDDTKLSATVGAGIETSEEASEEGDLEPFGFRVGWIAGVDLSRLSSNARDQLKTGLRAVIDDLIESMIATERTYRDLKVVMVDDRQDVKVRK